MYVCVLMLQMVWWLVWSVLMGPDQRKSACCNSVLFLAIVAQLRFLVPCLT